jgi:hypothetical protein
VVFTTVFSLAGGLSPALWLLAARAGALASLVLAYALATRLGGRLAGLLAVAGIALTQHWLTDFAGGASEPLLTALVLGAIELHLARRPGAALGLWLAASLLRPEAWPFLFAYGCWWAGGRPRRWLGLALILASVPVAWFVPEWIGAGDPLHGTKLAQFSHEARQTHAMSSPVFATLRAGLGLLMFPLWVGFTVAIARAYRESERLPLWLAGTAVAWIAVELTMTALGYAGIARFMLPAAALAAVVGAVGVKRLALDAVPGQRLAALALLAVIVIPFAAVRVVRLAHDAAVATLHRSLQRDLFVLLDRLGGRAGLRAQGPMLVKNEYRGAMAWKLQVPEELLRAPHPRLFLRRRGHALPGFPRGRVRQVTVAAAGPWRAVRVAGGPPRGRSARRPRPARRSPRSESPGGSSSTSRPAPSPLPRTQSTTRPSRRT